MTQSLARPALVLGLLSCIGPFAIDMYLPAMPAIGADLATSVQAMQAFGVQDTDLQPDSTSPNATRMIAFYADSARARGSF